MPGLVRIDCIGPGNSSLWEHDSIEIFICSDQPGFTEAGFSLEDQFHQILFDREGNLCDGYKAKDEQSVDYGVNLDLDLKITRREKDFTFEMAIPYASLYAIPPTPGITKWKVNFYRNRKRPRSQEGFHAWSPTGGPYNDTSRFGTLGFPESTGAHFSPRKPTGHDKSTQIIDSLDNIEGWKARDPEVNIGARKGTMQVAMTVDHITNNSIGWPAIEKYFTGNAQLNLSEYRTLSFWLFVSTHAELPDELLLLQVYPASREPRTVDFPVTKVEKGKWVQVKLPLVDFKSAVPDGLVSKIKFATGERYWNHGDKVTFYFDELVAEK